MNNFYLKVILLDFERLKAVETCVNIIIFYYYYYDSK